MSFVLPSHFTMPFAQIAFFGLGHPMTNSDLISPGLLQTTGSPGVPASCLAITAFSFGPPAVPAETMPRRQPPQKVSFTPWPKAESTKSPPPKASSKTPLFSALPRHFLAIPCLPVSVRSTSKRQRQAGCFGCLSTISYLDSVAAPRMPAGCNLPMCRPRTAKVAAATADAKIAPRAHQPKRPRWILGGRLAKGSCKGSSSDSGAKASILCVLELASTMGSGCLATHQVRAGLDRADPATRCGKPATARLGHCWLA
mmetsp:Transcript_81370/g.181987  ORF Transcript_81370/g.181987 Transcript_81370/m.181987 type:complete len:256 (-) Transcript_81370:2-769(-)